MRYLVRNEGMNRAARREAFAHAIHKERKPKHFQHPDKVDKILKGIDNIHTFLRRAAS